VRVVCGDAAAAEDFLARARGWRLASPGRLRPVIVGAEITTWCKDRFLVAQRGGGTSLLLVPDDDPAGEPLRRRDRLVSQALARSDPALRTIPAGLRFEGGDVVATRRHLFVSDLLYRRNAGIGRADFRRRLEAIFGLRVVWLRGAPDHHISMYAMPFDERTVVVGDPSLGRRLAVGESAVSDADFSAAAAAPFLRVARDLETLGFRVVRVPLVPTRLARVYVTYTNVIIDQRRGRTVVYMPTYGLECLDAAAGRTWASLGAEVKPVPVQAIYRFRGTIGCLVNVLRRDPASR